MRFLLFFSLFLISPLDAGALKARKPANASGGAPAKVITFSCRENPDEPVLALGLAHLRIDMRDANAASAGVSLYVQVKNNNFAMKNFTGTAVAVPGGYSISLDGVENLTINLHPHERTIVPGLPGRPLRCESTAVVNSN
jgi:hypothetical protein